MPDPRLAHLSDDELRQLLQAVAPAQQQPSESLSAPLDTSGLTPGELPAQPAVSTGVNIDVPQTIPLSELLSASASLDTGRLIPDKLPAQPAVSTNVNTDKPPTIPLSELLSASALLNTGGPIPNELPIQPAGATDVNINIPQSIPDLREASGPGFIGSAKRMGGGIVSGLTFTEPSSDIAGTPEEKIGELVGTIGPVIASYGLADLLGQAALRIPQVGRLASSIPSIVSRLITGGTAGLIEGEGRQAVKALKGESADQTDALKEAAAFAALDAVTHGGGKALKAILRRVKKPALETAEAELKTAQKSVAEKRIERKLEKARERQPLTSQEISLPSTEQVKPKPVELPNVEASRPVPKTERPVSRQESLFPEMKPVASPKPKPPVKPKVKPAESELGKTIGLNKEGQDLIRKEIDASPLPPAKKQKMREVHKRVIDERLYENALTTAAELKHSGRPLTATEHVSMVVKAAQLSSELKTEISNIAKIVEHGGDPSVAVAREKVLRAQLDELTDAARSSRRETARALAIGRVMVHEKAYDVVTLTQRAKAISGRPLTSKETTSLHRAAERIKKLEADLEKANAREQEWLKEKDRILAEKVVANEKRVKKIISHRKSVEAKLAAEQKELENELVKMGLRARLGLDPELAFTLGKYAFLQVKRGANTVDAVVKRVQAKFPELTDSDVHEALAMRDPRRQAKARSEITKLISELRTQARIENKIDRLSQGLPEIKGTRREVSARVKQLQKELRDLRSQVYRSDIEADRLEKAIHQINELQDQLTNYYRPLRKKRIPESSKLQRAKRKVRDLRARIRAEDQLADVNEKLRTGDITVQKRTRTTTMSPELKQIKIRLKEARKELRDLRLQSRRSNKGLTANATEAKRLEAAVRKVKELQSQLVNTYRPLRKARAPESAELQGVKQKVRDLRAQLRTEDKLADLNEQLRTGEFVIREKPKPTPMSPELERARIQLKRARQQVNTAIANMAPLTFRRGLRKTADLLRTLKAMADFSGTLRQGLILSVSHPQAVPKNFVKSVKSFFDKYTAEQVDLAIRSEPDYYLFEKAGIDLPEVGGVPGKHEELFASQWAERIPKLKEVVLASERHMTTFLNLMRVDYIKRFLELNPNATSEELKAVADWINVASGRGNLGRFAVANEVLAYVAFAPRFAVSRFETPFMLLKYWKQPRVRKAIAADYAKMAAFGTLTLSIAKLAGAKLATDPNDPDWGKIRVGNTHVDIWGGVQQPMRLITRIGLGATDSFKNVDPVELIGRFSSYKIAPIVGVPYELIRHKTITGEPRTAPETALRAVIPIVAEDIADAYKEYGLSPATAAIGTGAMLGVGVQTYQDSRNRARKNVLDMLNEGETAKAKTFVSKWNKKRQAKQKPISIDNVLKSERTRTIKQVKKLLADKKKAEAAKLVVGFNKLLKANNIGPLEVKRLYLAVLEQQALIKKVHDSTRVNNE